MDHDSVHEIINATEWPRRMATASLGMLAIFLLVLTVSALKGFGYIGSGVQASNTITVTGHGEIFAAPDTAEFSVTVQEKAKDVPTAQTAATKDANSVDDYLKAQGINESDIQTTDYSVTPQYEYQNTSCASGVYCPPGKQILTGYEVSETFSVKVTDTSKAGALLSGVGQNGASQVSGLTFTVADENGVQAQARDKAVADAKQKADALAKSLGVSLVRIVGFSENNQGGVVPMYMKASFGADSAASTPSPDIQTGQNKYSDDVTITYEI